MASRRVPRSFAKERPAADRDGRATSGNPRGRTRGRKREIPHDHVLGQMVTIREDGRERQVTAAEAFLLQLTKKGLEGCSASARASLASIEQARALRHDSIDRPKILRVVLVASGHSHIAEKLGIGTSANRTDKRRVRFHLKPWIVQAAVDRMKANQLDLAAQAIVVASTRTPENVEWPDWWTVRA